MGISGYSLKMVVLASLLFSFDPFKIGLRRRQILDLIIHSDIEYVLNCEVIPQRFDLIPQVFRYPLTSGERDALDMRLLRVLESLVKDELIKRKSKDNKQVFYLIEEDTFLEFLEYYKEYAGRKMFLDKEEWAKNFRQTITNRSDYLKLPDYMAMIPLTNYLYRDLTYEEFRSKIMNVVVEVLEPQIKVQYELIPKDQ